MFAVSKHVTLWMRQTGSEGRGEAGKFLLYTILCYLLSNIFLIFRHDIPKDSKIEKY